MPITQIEDNPEDPNAGPIITYQPGTEPPGHENPTYPTTPTTGGGGGGGGGTSEPQPTSGGGGGGGPTEPDDPDPLERLADLYTSAFGSKAGGEELAVVPVGPDQGGGSKLGLFVGLAALGVGGWWLWKKFGKEAA